MFSKNLVFTLISQILKISKILTCSFFRVSLNPPKKEKKFSSSGAQKELTLILREIRVILLIPFFSSSFSLSRYLDLDPGDSMDPLHLFSFSLSRYLDLDLGDLLDLFSFLNLILREIRVIFWTPCIYSPFLFQDIWI